jgi:metal-responsive CopG/Arc/MetJ family transcriptional regulator
MEIISVKFQEDVMKKVDRSIAEHNFNSRTEFIREAVRDKLDELKKEDLIKELMKFRGKAPKKTTDEERARVREEVSKELMEYYDKKFK